MMRSLYAAVSGLRTHQTKMDIVANNIANVNTYGFKSSRVSFQDIFYQTLSAGSEPSDTLGGTNPKQIGLGVTNSSIDTNHTQGATAYTGRGTDLMIQGDGFFVLSDGTNLYLTRTGNFSFNAVGDLIQPSTGLYVMDVAGDHLTVDPNGKSYSFDTTGKLTYVDSDGTVQEGGQVAIAKFPNPNGLLQVGQNLYQWHQAAGDEVSGGGFDGGGIPGEEGRGTIIPGSLEMSNVELAQEITDMIVTQRGFQANARVITTSDQMLEELANLKR